MIKDKKAFFAQCLKLSYSRMDVDIPAIFQGVHGGVHVSPFLILTLQQTLGGRLHQEIVADPNFIEEQGPGPVSPGL